MNQFSIEPMNTRYGIMMEIEQNVFKEIYFHSEFEKEFNKLKKKWRSLEEDLITFINTPLKLFHKQSLDVKGIQPISGLGIINTKIYIAKRFACKALKGTGSNSGIRIIYAYIDENDSIEFIEMYYKGDKDYEDKERIIRLYQ